MKSTQLFAFFVNFVYCVRLCVSFFLWLSCISFLTATFELKLWENVSLVTLFIFCLLCLHLQKTKTFHVFGIFFALFLFVSFLIAVFESNGDAPARFSTSYWKMRLSDLQAQQCISGLKWIFLFFYFFNAGFWISFVSICDLPFSFRNKTAAAEEYVLLLKICSGFKVLWVFCLGGVVLSITSGRWDIFVFLNPVMQLQGEQYNDLASFLVWKILSVLISVFLESCFCISGLWNTCLQQHLQKIRKVDLQSISDKNYDLCDIFESTIFYIFISLITAILFFNLHISNFWFLFLFFFVCLFIFWYVFFCAFVG